MTKRNIKEEKQGCHNKSHFNFNDKEVQLAIHECIFCLGDKLSVQKLAKALNDYLGSQKIANNIWEIFEKKSILKENNIKQLPLGFKIRI